VVLLLLFFSIVFRLMSLMNTSSEQPLMQEMSQKHSNDIAIKEVLKLVALSRFLQENPHEMWSHCNVSIAF